MIHCEFVQPMGLQWIHRKFALERMTNRTFHEWRETLSSLCIHNSVYFELFSRQTLVFHRFCFSQRDFTRSNKKHARFDCFYRFQLLPKMLLNHCPLIGWLFSAIAFLQFSNVDTIKVLYRSIKLCVRKKLVSFRTKSSENSIYWFAVQRSCSVELWVCSFPIDTSNIHSLQLVLRVLRCVCAKVRVCTLAVIYKHELF